MSGQVRVTNQQRLGYVPHTSVSGESWQFVAAGTTTGAGGGGGATIVDTSADSGGADTYNGRYWVRIKPGQTNGDMWKRVIDDNGTGTLTLENNGFPAQVGSGIEYEIWKSPEPVVVVDSSSGETDMVDAVRADGDDFWNDYYAVPITGTHRGKVAQVTDFVSSTGTFTLAASFGSALAAGDVVLLRKFVEVGDASPGLTRGYEPRPALRSDFARGDGVITTRGGTFGFSTDVVASGSLAASGSKANSSTISGLLQACGYTETIGTSVTVDDASATTSQIDIDTGTWENLAIGMPISHNGNISFVTGLTDGAASADTIDISPALPIAPADNDEIAAGRIYKLDTTATELGVTLEWEVDGERITMTGCKGSASLNDGAKMAFAFELQVDHWVREIEVAPYSASTTYTSAKAILNSERLFYVDGSKEDIAGFTASLNTEVTPRNVQGNKGLNGRCGFQISNFAAGATWRGLLETSDELTADERHGARGTHEIVAVFGSHGDAVAVRIPKARYVEDPLTADQDGQRAAPHVVRAHDAGSTTDGGGSTVKDPDFILGIM